MEQSLWYTVGVILGILAWLFLVLFGALSAFYRLLSEWLAPPRQPSPHRAEEEAALYNAHASQPRRANPNCRSVIVLKTDDDPPPFVVRAARHVPRPLETKDLS